MVKKMFEVFHKSRLRTQLLPKNQNIENEIQKKEIMNLKMTIDNDLQATLKNLEAEEKSLLQEQADLASVKENLNSRLTQKLKEEIMSKETKISELKQKIPELKQECESLANMLGVDTSNNA